MKPSLPLFSTLAATCVLLGARLLAPRASLAQTPIPQSKNTHIHPPPTPAPVAYPDGAPASNRLLKAGDVTGGTFWTRREPTTPYGPNTPQEVPSNDGGVLWAIQNRPNLTNTALYGVNPSSSVSYDLLGLRVVFHSRFHDGATCGAWSPTQIRKPGDGFTATFTAPRRADWGWMWAEYWNQQGQKIGRSKDQLFLVLPVRILCKPTEWKPTGRTNEWSREVHTFAGCQVPQEWQSQRAFAKAASKTYIPNDIFPLPHVPLRLRIAPAPFIDAGTMPASTLSIKTGTTAAPINSREPVSLQGWMPRQAPGVVTTQTVHWKLGDSNQLDAARVVAQFNFPATKGASP